ncbi:unnamed protein product [Rhizophagus irregularis]|nr:unnamed protein product [Rhizophagus irregularis]CAB4400590.1 unnamed protein product [Rhizophagus irregularis]
MASKISSVAGIRKVKGLPAHISVTYLIASIYMHMASKISSVAGIRKVKDLPAHIVLKLPFILSNDIL